MSIETDFVDALDAHAALTALVGVNISKNAVAQDAALPLIVFNATHDRQGGIDGTTQLTQSIFQVECWSNDGDEAAAVADAVEAALAVYDLAHTAASVAVTNRGGIYNEDLKLDGEALTVEWWSQ